ncbi:hypothetical protein GKA01_25240 [Gluconobacter kanchanaburiensis NBRC 103587]|uniref:Uncharacterized protein n=1 Tax=Gluconobacter kanchanaburiensis NBRC 103587 TaxID=1307948 RepID=A0A511BHP5_9PROT|nr:hypothetical protein GKA01_25240 [Gluconobacter kanchanaburiensis NBRC 103587]
MTAQQSGFYYKEVCNGDRTQAPTLYEHFVPLPMPEPYCRLSDRVLREKEQRSFQRMPSEAEWRETDKPLSQKQET